VACGPLWIQPSIGYDAIRVFKAPQHGYYRFFAQLTGLSPVLNPIGDGIQFNVFKNGVSLMPSNCVAKLSWNSVPSSTSSFDTSFTTYLNSNDNVYFQASKRVTSYGDIVYWPVTVQYAGSDGTYESLLDTDNDGIPDYLDSDSDADGLPDAWEMQYFGNLSQSGGGDYDGDGISNYTEYLQGRNPLQGTVDDVNGILGLSVHTPLK
jgi:hypothetical protein